ncbi:acetate--CoA ligase family protein [Saccharopolyspora spinosa]|uniref:Acyl-CoA synthetase (NDP forming) n=1 Tax=Saccharopolyspora spinosa TaxID=60894 RepID=A0A2N3Y1Q4_SACSN|nr:acetate--CoA ligase family protein [Saccharopolyspora spinosa]PKW16835.1 acyl-CoA synthetase (NDP forming) [Saccharopolyspora spinosa]
MTVRTPSTRDGLDALLDPRSIAVLGASADPAKVGGMPLRFLREVGYPGRLFGVNPRRPAIDGATVVSSLSEIDEPVDLAVIALPAERAVTEVENCANAGVPAAVVLSSGFAEVGPVGVELQHRLRDIVDRTGIRVCGPNCAGVMNVHSRMTATFGSHLAADTTLIPGSIAIVSQSGAVGAYTFTLARRRGIGLSQWITTGNEADLQIADFVAAIADDPRTTVIALYLEQIRDPEALIQATAKARAAGKRLVGILSGRTEAAEHALRSHTAALAGDRQVTAAALEAMGVVLVERIDELLDTAIGLATAKTPTTDGVGLVTISGAAGVMMVDRCTELGLCVPALPDAAQRRLKHLVPYAATTNPVDITGSISSHPELFGAAVEELLQHQEIGSIVCFVGHVGLSPHVGKILRDTAARLSRDTAKPIWLVGLFDHDPAASGSHTVPVVTEPAAAVNSLAATRRAGRSLPAIEPARVVMAPSTSGPRPTFLSEVESQRMLPGVRFPRQEVVTTPAAARDAAARLGGHVVLKVIARTLPHKSDIDGVRVGVSEDHAPEAFAEIMAAVRRNAPGTTIDGILVQEMADGFPVIVGARVDDAFGPMVVVSQGGLFTEVLGTPAIGIAPAGPEAVENMLEQAGIAAVLRHPRGRSFDGAALRETIGAVSRSIWAHRATVASIELNPVLVSADGAIAVDALVEKRSATSGTD